MAALSNVKGSAIVSRILWVRLNHGEFGVAKLANDSSPELRMLVERGAGLSKWYPFGVFIEVNERIDSLFGNGDLELVRELGRYGADAHLTTIYRLFYKVGTVYWILGRAARLWNAYYDTGRLEVYTRGVKQVELRLVQFANPHKAHCTAVAGWVERSIELSGGTSVQVKESACRTEGAPFCQLVCEWQ